MSAKAAQNLWAIDCRVKAKEREESVFLGEREHFDK